MLLLFPIGTLVPSLMGSAPAAVQQDAPESVNEVVGEAEQSDVELDMMYFTPSASIEDGIYYVTRRGGDPVAYFGESEVYYVVGDTLLRLEFPGSMTVIPAGEAPTGSVTNYIYGNDPCKWRTGLQDCEVLRYVDLYPGIDLRYKVSDANLKYEFVVAPGADPSQIQMRYPDSSRVDVKDDSVTIAKEGVAVADTALMVFQSDGRVVRECSFQSLGPEAVGFSVGRYDTSRELIVDPLLLTYSTFLGGSGGDTASRLAVEDGYVYVTGRTSSSDFPTVNPFDSAFNGTYDCFVTKFAADGQSLIYSTFLGGSSWDMPYGIAVENGFVYLTGETYSSDFPTYNPFDSTLNGTYDCFVAKLAIDGQSLVYSTFLGGTSVDENRNVVVENGLAYVYGQTYSSDFPTVNAYDSTLNGSGDCFVSKLAADGSSLIYSTFLGGSAAELSFGIAVENGLVYVDGRTASADFPTVNAFNSTHSGGEDCFVSKLAANGSALIYSTFLGGSSDEMGAGIDVDDGFAYLTGYTGSSNFPTANAYDSTYGGAGYDCFVTKLAANGSSLVFSTFLGGTASEQPYGLVVEYGYVYVSGRAASTDFPVVNAYDSTQNGGNDCFVTCFTNDGQSLLYSTYLGAASGEFVTWIALEDGAAYITGYTDSSGFPTVNAYSSTYGGSTDAFLAVLYEDTDTDMDGLEDWRETWLGTDVSCIDSDNDNFLDGYEVAYGSDPMDPMSYPGMPQSWYDVIYEDLDGNATLIQQVISWLDGNHTAIETLFMFVDGNATLLIQTVNAVNANSTRLDLLAALVSQDVAALSSFNASYIGDMAEIRAVLDTLGVTVGDTDYDGLDDLDEIAQGTDIQCIDTDCDNLNDAYEVKIGTDPTDDDTDNDTYFDGAEVLAGSDPLDALDYPGSTSATTTTQPPLGIEFIIVAGAAGCVGLILLLVLIRRRAGAK